MIFLSHSSQDKRDARRVLEALAMEGLPCWLDEHQLHDGVELSPNLRRAIGLSHVFLYLVSNAANDSRWVQAELEFALNVEHEGELRIVPVRSIQNEDPLPLLLVGRKYSRLEPSIGGAARLAHSLAEFDGSRMRRVLVSLRTTRSATDHANRRSEFGGVVLVLERRHLSPPVRESSARDRATS